jgi:putative drug exporter of the RND superfamily
VASGGQTTGKDAAPTSQLALRVVAGPASGQTVVVGADPVILGRGQPAPANLGGDDQLSRSHAKVSRRNGSLVVEDLGSTNGTFLNGAAATEPAEIGAGDVLWLGLTTLLVAPAAEALPAVPPIEPPAPSAEAGFLAKLADLANRHPKRILGALGVFFILAVALGAPVVKILKDKNGFDDPHSEYVRTQERMGELSGRFAVPTVVLLRAGRDVRSPAVRAEIDRIAARLKADRAVARVLSFNSTRSLDFVSLDRRSTYVLAFYKAINQEHREEAAQRLQKALGDPPRIMFGGQAVALHELREQVGGDLAKAEGLAFPILFLLSLFVFRGLIAALLPMIVGVITVFGTFLVLRIINGPFTVTVFALNVVNGLGLGLAIDYSLFVLSRYREELVRVGQGRGGDPLGYGVRADDEGFAGSSAEALRRTMLTAGRTILFSAVTVAVAMAALMVFRQPFLYSMGIGGAVCALMAVLVSLVALPALLSVLGPRVNSFAPARWQRAAQRTASQERSGPWYRISQMVMDRPGLIAIAASALLIALGSNFLRVDFTGVNAGTLPTKLEAKQTNDLLERDFSTTPAADITVLADAPANAGAQVRAYADHLASLPGAATHAPPERLKRGGWLIPVRPWGDGLADETTALVRKIRSEKKPFPIAVTGETASFVDQKSSFGSHLPIALAILVISTVVILFLMTGSAILPIKSLAMNFLTIAGSLGLLVLIFQDGRFEDLLGFTSSGALDSSQPILIAGVAFGLSTDYAVFLLTRINEARKQGASDREAVAIGLERTGRIVTQAALLFVVAIGAFATSKVIFIKQIGVGTAAAVIIDATIIRALLVPSLMALLGRRNWWAPGPLRKLHNRFGLSEG